MLMPTNAIPYIVHFYVGNNIALRERESSCHALNLQRMSLLVKWIKFVDVERGSLLM